MNKRVIDISEFEKNKSKFTKNRLELISNRKEKAVRTRPRDPEEVEVLIKLTGLRWKKWQEQGIIKKTGDRKFQVKIF